MSVVGQSILRTEDGRFLNGTARFIADIRLPGMLEAVVVRSPVAHARIVQIDIGAALATQGVVAVFTAGPTVGQHGGGGDGERHGRHHDLTGIGVYRPYHLSPKDFRDLVNPVERLQDVPLLATDRVRRVGEPVALVVAEDRYVAEDARDLIRLRLEELPAVLDPEKGLRRGAPIVQPELGDNLQSKVLVQCGDVAAAFAAAEHTASWRIKIGRQLGSPIETRGVVAAFEPEAAGLTVWSATQMPHLSRKVISGIVDLPVEQVRVVCPDMGGSFGGGVYYEDILVPFAAMRLARPVRFLEDRRENLANTRHGRDQIHDVDVAFDGDGRIRALRDRFVVDMGITNFYGLVVPYNTVSHLRGQYRIDNFFAEATCVLTNKTPGAPVRGAGRVAAIFVLERVVDRIARRLGLDPAEVRLRNLIPAEAMPYDLGIPYRDGRPAVYDSGDYPAQLRAALEAIDYAGFRRRQVQLRQEGRHVGIGIAAYTEGSGYGPHEGAIVRVDESGNVTVLSGSNSHGQSHETTLAQVCADALGVEIARITVRDGDTALIAQGTGTFASRSAVTAGNAVAGAARKVRDKALAVAASMLGAKAAELDIVAGRIQHPGGRSVTLADVAAALRPGSGAALPAGISPGLEELQYFVPPTVTWSSGTHIVTVEVDPATGQVRLDRYVVAHDCGRVLNPAVVDGQVVGGVAHGVGHAIHEEAVYDDAGQFRTDSFATYHLPRAEEVPAVEVIHQEFLSPLNEIGVKGCGEGGTVGAPAAIINAIEDALRPLDLEVLEMPLRPERLVALIDDAAHAASA